MNFYARWDPFQALETEEAALRAARRGVVVGGWLALYHGVFLILRLLQGAAVLAGFEAVLLAIVGGLIWRIRVRPGPWSCTAMALVAVLDLADRLLGVAVGSGALSNLWFFALIIAVASILSVRGGWRLAAIRRRGGLAKAAVFD